MTSELVRLDFELLEKVDDLVAHVKNNFGAETFSSRRAFIELAIERLIKTVEAESPIKKVKA